MNPPVLSTVTRLFSVPLLLWLLASFSATPAFRHTHEGGHTAHSHAHPHATGHTHGNQHRHSHSDASHVHVMILGWELTLPDFFSSLEPSSAGIAVNPSRSVGDSRSPARLPSVHQTEHAREVELWPSFATGQFVRWVMELRLLPIIPPGSGATEHGTRSVFSGETRYYSRDRDAPTLPPPESQARRHSSNFV